MPPTLELPMTAKDLDLVIRRTIDAPRDEVFRAWTDPEHAKHWWAPRGFVTTFCEMDVRRGGAWRVCIAAPDWGEMWMQGSFVEIASDNRLVFTFAWDDETSVPSHETIVSVTFSSLGGRTLFTLHQSVFENSDARGGTEDIWMSAFERLADYLSPR